MVDGIRVHGNNVGFVGDVGGKGRLRKIAAQFDDTQSTVRHNWGLGGLGQPGRVDLSFTIARSSSTQIWMETVGYTRFSHFSIFFGSYNRNSTI